MKKVVIAVLAGVVVIGGVVFAMSRNSDNSTATPTSTDTSNQTTSASTTPAAANVTITYDGSNFSPSTATVKSGGTVTVKNTSLSVIQFNSDPHPSHGDDTELNIGTINPGSSQTITVTTVGTHGYHNHLDPTQTGTLVVE